MHGRQPASRRGVWRAPHTREAGGRRLPGRSEASDSFREPVMESRKVNRHESLQFRHLCVASNLRVEQEMIRFGENSQRVVSIATRFERRFPRSFVLFRDDIVVEFTK
jgi:hypothetical protein